MPMSTAPYSKAMWSPLLNSASIRNPKIWISSVDFNVSFTTTVGECCLSLHIYIYIYIYLFAILRLHAGVSTVEPQTRQAIPFDAFIDAVDDYEAESQTDDEGDQMNA